MQACLEETGGDIEKASALLKERDTPPPPSAPAARLARARSPATSTLAADRRADRGQLRNRLRARTDEFQRWPRLASVAGRGRSADRRIDPRRRARSQAEQLLATRRLRRSPRPVRASHRGPAQEWFAEVVSLSSPSAIRTTVRRADHRAIAKHGENMKVRRFVRFELGRRCERGNAAEATSAQSAAVEIDGGGRRPR